MRRKRKRFRSHADPLQFRFVAHLFFCDESSYDFLFQPGIRKEKTPESAAFEKQREEKMLRLDGQGAIISGDRCGFVEGLLRV